MIAFNSLSSFPESEVWGNRIWWSHLKELMDWCLPWCWFLAIWCFSPLKCRVLVLTIGWIIFLSCYIPVHLLLKGHDKLRKKLEVWLRYCFFHPTLQVYPWRAWTSQVWLCYCFFHPTLCVYACACISTFIHTYFKWAPISITATD